MTKWIPNIKNGINYANIKAVKFLGIFLNLRNIIIISNCWILKVLLGNFWLDELLGHVTMAFENGMIEKNGQVLILLFWGLFPPPSHCVPSSWCSLAFRPLGTATTWSRTVTSWAKGICQVHVDSRIWSLRPYCVLSWAWNIHWKWKLNSRNSVTYSFSNFNA